jgi:hypothetical protein
MIVLDGDGSRAPAWQFATRQQYLRPLDLVLADQLEKESECAGRRSPGLAALKGNLALEGPAHDNLLHTAYYLSACGFKESTSVRVSGCLQMMKT